MRVTNAFQNDLNAFPVDNQSEINKLIRKPMKAPDVGNNQGQRWLLNVPTSRRVRMGLTAN